jgi:hypothetical protein
MDQDSNTWSSTHITPLHHCTTQIYEYIELSFYQYFIIIYWIFWSLNK